MSLFVVDATVVAKWFIPEALSREARNLLDPHHDLACPDLLWPEIGRVLWKKTRRSELTPREAVRILRAVDECPLAVFPSELLVEGALEIIQVRADVDPAGERLRGTSERRERRQRQVHFGDRPGGAVVAHL